MGLTDAADSEGEVVKVEAVDPLPVGQEAEHDPADGVGDADDRQQEAGVVLVDAQQQCSVLERKTTLRYVSYKRAAGTRRKCNTCFLPCSKIRI